MVGSGKSDEQSRLEAVQGLGILYTPPTAAFDAIVTLAASIFGCSTSLISFMADDHQWFKARRGIDLEGTSRDIAFCDYTIRTSSILVINDTLKDDRFATNPLVTGAPYIRFYAGVPLCVEGIHNLGALCVIDPAPRYPSAEQIQQLVLLGKAVEGLLLTHRHSMEAQSAREEAERLSLESARRETLLKQVERMAEIGAWRVDIATGQVTWSDQVRIIHELPEGETLNVEEGLKFYLEPDQQRVKSALESAVLACGPFAVEADFMTARGRKRRVRCMGDVETENGAPKQIIGIIQDITARHEAEQQLWLSAHVDHLSGIANRNWFQKDLSERLVARGGTDEAVHLILIDLDGFKEINDTLGHQAGDHIISVTAQRLKAMAGDHSFTARLGGDEFAIVVNRPFSTETLRAFTDELLLQVRSPISFGEQIIHVAASIGVSRCPGDADNPDDLLRCADMALYKVKRTGRGSAGYFSAETASVFDARRNAIEKVRLAASSNRIVPFYQPKFRLADRAIYGFEALARIENADGSVSTPSEFWPAFADATSSRLIAEQMLERITADIARWMAAGINPGVVSFNACEASFQNEQFADDLLAKIDAMNIPRSMFEVEVTENVFWGDDPGLVERLLTTLRQAGLRVSLDDFGTGYASLTHLRDFPIDTLKIDQSFVAGLGKQPKNTAIVSAIVELGHNLGMDVVAEGIETQRQLDFLRSIQCDNGQGYLVSKPVPAVAVAGILRGDRGFSVAV